MPTLIYSPAIKVHVATSKGILDLSEDITTWKLDLRENGVHVFSFQLQNARRKYDGRILPMDRISVGLKRINWLQNMTGYLNDGPIFQAWPGTLDLTASCTLKALQFLYWDSQTNQSFDLITSALKNPETMADGASGLTRLAVSSLQKVAKWGEKPHEQRIHIGKVPKEWYTKFAEKVGKQIQDDLGIYQAIGGQHVLNGAGSGSTAQIPAGRYGGHSWNLVQARNASTIMNTIVSKMNINDDDDVLTMALMCSMQEASLLNQYNPNVPGSESYQHDDKAGTDHASVGLFQQQVPMWGPVSVCQNPESATKNFIDRLMGNLKLLPPRAKRDFGQLVQGVQRSAFPDAYTQWEPDAKAMVAAFHKLQKAAPQVPFGTVDLGGNAKSTGSMVARVATNLIAAHKTNPIRYQLGNDDPDTTPIDSVTTLDCSSLVDWVYYNATGHHLYSAGEGRTVVSTILAKSTQIPLDLAKYIQGAVLIKGPNDHVAVSVGDGSTCVAAKTDSAPPGQQVVAGDPIDGNGFNIGGLLPGIDYTQSATTQDAARKLQQVLSLSKTPPLAPALPNSGASDVVGVGTPASDPFQSLINGLYFNNQADGLMGSAFGGPVALINDQPFLPWLQNVINASMRSFCSAPNGDFIAWFPDYFGIWKTGAVMNIEPIELQDFTVYWSDQQIVTHQFVLGNPGATTFDSSSGGVGFQSGVALELSALANSTSGVATMDYPEIFKAIYGDVSDSGFIDAFLERFGARPDVQQMPYIHQGTPEFFMALYLFMQRWAGMFTASIPMTFMPELFPGMLLRIPEFGFQAYVRGVTHTGVYGQNGGFTTTVDVCAPSVIGGKNKDNLMALLPKGGPRR